MSVLGKWCIEVCFITHLLHCHVSNVYCLSPTAPPTGVVQCKTFDLAVSLTCWFNVLSVSYLSFMQETQEKFPVCANHGETLWLHCGAESGPGAEDTAGNSQHWCLWCSNTGELWFWPYLVRCEKHKEFHFVFHVFIIHNVFEQICLRIKHIIITWIALLLCLSGYGGSVVFIKWNQVLIYHFSYVLGDW